MPNHWVYQGPDGQWIHGIEGVEQAAGIYATQTEAWEAARQAARQDQSEAFLKGEDGRIRIRNTYGHDPRDIAG